MKLFSLGMIIVFLLIAGCTPDSGNNTNNSNNNTNNSNNLNNTNNLNLCDGETCSGHGVCLVQNSAAYCDCAVGYDAQGMECIQKSDPCDGETCSNHGSCVVDGNNLPSCNCDIGYEVDGLNCVESTDPCAGVSCSNHGSCVASEGLPSCNCDNGFVEAGPAWLECVESGGSSSCAGINCSNNGNCDEITEGSNTVAVCTCNTGYVPSGNHGLDCVPVEQVCTGGAINYDYDADGTNDTWFDPSVEECTAFEVLNRTRATHNAEGTPESHRPLKYSLEWSAHGRNHCYYMQNLGHLEHGDYPMGQNISMGYGDAESNMNGYMTGPSEPHCPELSHHCNIMRPSFSFVGIGYLNGYYWNTQNFL